MSAPGDSNFDACVGGMANLAVSVTTESGQLVVDTNKKKRICEGCQREFVSGNQLAKHIKNSPGCEREDKETIKLQTQQHVDTAATTEKNQTLIADEINKLKTYLFDKVDNSSDIQLILHNITNIILPTEQQHEKLKRGIYLFDVDNVHAADGMQLEVLLSQLGAACKDSTILAQIDKLLLLFRSAISKHPLSPTGSAKKVVRSEVTSKQKKGLNEDKGETTLNCAQRIINELDAIGSRDKWAEDFVKQRETIDCILSQMIYFAEPTKIPYCIGCYCLFSATNRPQDSHILSEWYLRKVVLGIRSEKLTFVSNEAEMTSNTKTGRMTVPMLCSDCEGMHSPLEGALGSNQLAVDALFSLKCNGCMPSDNIEEPTQLNFMKPGDGLRHDSLYGFLVTNLMRSLGNLLRDPEIKEHFWQLFDNLRAEIRVLSTVAKGSAESTDLFLYCIPIGCHNWMQVTCKWVEIALVPNDNFSSYMVCSSNVGKFFAIIEGPLVLIGNTREVRDLSKYQIKPCNDVEVVLSLAKGNTLVANILYSLHMKIFLTSKNIVLRACDDTVYDYSTIAAVESIKHVKFGKECVKWWVERLHRLDLHMQLLAWCQHFDSHATEDVYSRFVHELVPNSGSTRLKIRQAEALKQLSFNEMKLFTKCFGKELIVLVPAAVPTPMIPILTENECVTMMKRICSAIGFSSYIYRLKRFAVNYK